MAEGIHPFPFRTRKLSPPASKILVEQSTGKIDRRQINTNRPFERVACFFGARTGGHRLKSGLGAEAANVQRTKEPEAIRRIGAVE